MTQSNLDNGVSTVRFSLSAWLGTQFLQFISTILHQFYISFLNLLLVNTLLHCQISMFLHSHTYTFIESELSCAPCNPQISSEHLEGKSSTSFKLKFWPLEKKIDFIWKNRAPPMFCSEKLRPPMFG